MAEGPQVETSVHTHVFPTGCKSASTTHLSKGVELHEEDGANQRSEYCRELLMRDGDEFSFEELRAERHKQKKQQELTEKLRRVEALKEQLSLEIEQKNKLLLLRRSQQQVSEGSSPQISDSALAAASFQIYDESQSAAAAAARPVGGELPDNVFLPPDERGLCVKIQLPHLDPQRGATKESRLPAVSQRPASKSRDNLSPIQETSVEANSVTSLGGCSPLDEEQEVMDHVPSPVGGAVDPCDPDVRRGLLDLSDVTSCPDFHSDAGPLPAVDEHSSLQLGGEVYHTYSRVLDGGSFSIYKGTKEEDDVLIKVDSCSVPWDFHQFHRLKKNSSTADSLPLVSCFLFLDGCITVYITPTDHMFTEMAAVSPSEWPVCRQALCLLQLVSQLHSCSLLHAALQPNVLTCLHRGILRNPVCVFPVDWSSSVDLDLQRSVTSVQQVPSAQHYISLGLLEPNAPPQLVDLVGVAETVHLLLTNSRMIAVKDDDGWTAEQFSRDEPCNMASKMWRGFFRSLLNVGSRSPLSVLSELKEQLSALYQ